MRSHAEFEGYEIKITFSHNKLANLDLLPIKLFLVDSHDKALGHMSVFKQFST